MNKLKKKLDKLKSNTTFSNVKIQKVEQKYAEKLCPLKIGNTITVRHNKEFNGIVDAIHPFYLNPVDTILPQIGKYPSWSVSGKRIKKSTQKTGKWTFKVNPEAYHFDENTKTFEPKTLDEIINTIH